MGAPRRRWRAPRLEFERRKTTIFWMFRKDGGCLLAHTNHLARGRVRSFASPGREIPTRRERTGTRYGGVLGPATSAKRKTIAARRDRRGAPRGKFGKEPAKDDVRC